jgi:hypothetical protein
MSSHSYVRRLGEIRDWRYCQALRTFPPETWRVLTFQGAQLPNITDIVARRTVFEKRLPLEIVQLIGTS